MEIEDFKKLKNEIDKDILFEEEYAQQKLVELPKLQQHYLDIATLMAMNLKKKQLEVDRTFARKFKYFKFDDNLSWDGNKGQIEIQVRGDKEYQDKLRSFYQLEVMLKHVESTISNLKQLHFTIKTYLEFRKFQTGTY